MIEVKKSVIVPYTPEKMFNLVSDFEHYSTYLPWCNRSELKEQHENTIIGAIYIEYMKIKTYFVTKNTNIPHSKIYIDLLEGPFHDLNGSWTFTPLGDNGCKVDFLLRYNFANSIIEKVIGPVFSYISKNIVDCFIKQAHKIK